MSNIKNSIEVHNLTVSYRNTPVLWCIDFAIREGVNTAIVGPNGAGKSTLLKSIMGLIKPSTGYVQVYGDKLENKKALIAYVPQRSEVDWDFPINVFDVVMMGRYNHIPFYSFPRKKDKEIVLESLTKVGMEPFIKRQISELSGGQQQRVFIARALAQEAQLFLMDEPFAGVDAATENSIIEIFKSLKQEGKSIVCVHHDLNTVADYFDDLVLINLRLVAAGTIKEVFNAENLNQAYGGRLGLLSEIVERVRKYETEKRLI